MRFATIEDIDRIITEKGLLLVSDANLINEKIETVFGANPKAVKDKALGFLVGKILKEVNAEPTFVKELVEQKLNASVM